MLRFFQNDKVNVENYIFQKFNLPKKNPIKELKPVDENFENSTFFSVTPIFERFFAMSAKIFNKFFMLKRAKLTNKFVFKLSLFQFAC